MTDTNTPERIWAEATGMGRQVWRTHAKYGGAEYIRADLAAREDGYRAGVRAVMARLEEAATLNASYGIIGARVAEGYLDARSIAEELLRPAPSISALEAPTIPAKIDELRDALAAFAKGD